VAIPLSDRVPGRASGPSRSRVDDGDGSRCVSGKLIGYLGFSRRGVFIHEGAMSKVEPGGLTPWRCSQGLGRANLVCGPLWLPSYSTSDLWKLPGKIRLQELVSSNSVNISCVSLLKHKNSRKQGTVTVATC
jgi:hypothetical protein